MAYYALPDGIFPQGFSFGVFCGVAYDYTLSIDESLYLLIHLKRILDEEQETK